MSMPPAAPPRRARPAWVVLAVAVLAFAAGMAALAMRLTASAEQATVALVATQAAAETVQHSVADVTLTGDRSVLLVHAIPSLSRAPALTDLGVHAVPGSAYTGVSATVDGRQVSVRVAVALRRGGVTPVLLVVRGGSISAAAGNDDVNHAALQAAGQLIHPPDVTFVDQTGRSVPLHGLRGKVVVVAALDAHCHDTCPLYTALWADLQRVVRERGWQDRVAIAEVSMDPDRDTPAELAAYGRMVDATWPLLRADPAPTLQFWSSLGAASARVPSPSPAPVDWYTGQPETYHLHHDSLAVVIDQRGDARYLLQGNPLLAHGLSPALAALMNGGTASAATLENAAGWSLTDLLDRVDTLLGAPLESERGAEQAARVGRRAPDIALRGLDGQTVSLRKQLGRAVVVTFWATWCQPCRHDMPLLAAAARSHPGLLVLAVDEGESSGQVRDYLGSVLGADAAQLTAVLDPDHAAGARYAVQGLPVTVFVGADGIVRTVRIGQLHAGDLGEQLAATGA
jgi:cytochrome oxidase Cu insertion factor (SCO1/SenC/PrrC family)/thiol-disulfide isomerase/thioredoxin